MIAGGIGDHLRTRELAQLFIAIFPMKCMCRIVVFVDLIDPFVYVVYMITAQYFPIGFIGKQKMQRIAVVLNNAERFVCLIVDAAKRVIIVFAAQLLCLEFPAAAE